MLVMAAVMIFIIIDRISSKDGMPAQMQWVRDGMLKWSVYLLLSLQSIASIINCCYLALITKYPLIAKKIKAKLMTVFQMGIFAAIFYHIPRFFLDLRISTSLCSLFNANELVYAYSLEYQKLKAESSGISHSAKMSTTTDG